MVVAAADRNCLALLHLCNSLPKLTQLQADILKSGLQNSHLVLTKFISVSSGLASLHHACSFVFSKESNPHCYDAFLFNTVIKAYAGTTSYKRTAVWYYNEMLFHGVKPSNYTYPFIFKACSGIGELDLGKSLHGSIVKLGFCGDSHILNSMLHMYCSCEGGFTLAEKVFDEMPKTESIPWSILMGGYLKWGMPNQVINLFREMQTTGRVKPDEITMVMLLSACADLGCLKLGIWFETCIEKEHLELTSELYNALIDMFSKCGDVDKALSLLRTMPANKRTIISWTSVIFGMSTHGRGYEAISLFEELIKTGESPPDDVTFIALLSACSHSGLVTEGKLYFESMVNEYRIVPRIEHYGCMVDLLCRGGLVEEAVRFVDEMPVAPNPVICRTLIGACQEHDQLKLGERISRELLKKEPMQEANYVLLSSIYVKMARWEKKINVREAMGKRGIRKIPGSTIIE